MGYDIQAIIGIQPVLQAHSASFASAVVAPLARGFALIPITDELLDEIGAAGDSGRFYKFTPAVTEWLQAISASAPVAYVEADYFGGVGSQGAVVWAHRAQILPPTHGPDAINIALRLLGVSRGTSQDEFEAIGLPRHRGTRGWLDDAIPNGRTT